MNSWCVHAPCCGFDGPLFATSAEAAKAWNTRATAAPVDKEQTIALFEGIIATNPDGYLYNDIVYQVTQDEMLKFAAALAAQQIEVTGQHQPKDNGLVSEEEFLFGWLTEMSELFTDVEVELKALDRSDLAALRAATSKVVKMLDEHERLQ